MKKRFLFISLLVFTLGILFLFPNFKSFSEIVGEDKGYFTISQYKNNEWVEVSTEEFGVIYSTKNIIVNTSEVVKIRIEEKGLPFADIEQVSLSACESELIPEYARYVDSGVSVYDDILLNDNNVIINHEMPIELSWNIPDGCNQNPILSLTANAYQSFEKNAFSFPADRSMYETYVFQNNGSLNIDGQINEVDGITDPTYSPFWLAGTGHPSNNTHMYFMDDDNYVYIAFDVTADNTDEYGYDWLKVFVENSTKGETTEYQVDDFIDTYGKCSFGLTSKVSYKHQTCEIKIPKSEIASNQIDFSISYYGTMAGPDGIPPVPNSFIPESNFLIGTSTPKIQFQTMDSARCRLSLLDESYSEMVDDIMCDDGYTQYHSCVSPDLGQDGEKNIYIACRDFDGDYDTSETNENLTYSLISTPVEIDTIEELENISDNTFLNYVLTKDLDFENCNSYTDCDNLPTYTTNDGWWPIGYYGYNDSFHGIFDGQGHTISNLYINRPTEWNIGLFGNVAESGEVQNLELKYVDISGYGYVGSLVGSLNGALINSYANGHITGEDQCIGGLVGQNYIQGEGVPGTMLNSYSKVSVTGYSGVGGLVGCNTGDVINSYSTGTVSAEYSVGGLIGSFDGGDIIDSYWDLETSGAEESNGGLGLTTENMQSLITYTGWDIVEMSSFDPSDPTVWYISDGDDYPRLYWEYEAPEVLTKAATNFTIDGATLNGELISMDGETEVGVYFRYRQGEGAWITVDGVTKTSSGVFSSPITGLTLNTQYQYQAVVTWRGVGTEYGNIVTFSTPETPPLPTVFGTVVSNIEDIQTPSNTESPLVLTKIGTGSITFPSGLNLTDNYEQLSNLSENLVIVYEPSLNRFRAYVNSNGASFLATNGAIIRFFNVRNQLGITGLTSSNFKTLLKVSVLDDSKSLVGDTSSYYDWNNASYNQDTDILTMPVNHFSEYVLGVNTGVLPSTGMSPYTLLIPSSLFLIGLGIVVISRKKKENF